MKTRAIVLLCVLLVLVPAVLAQSGGEESPGDATPTPPPPAEQVPIRKDTPLTVHLVGTQPVDLSYKTNGDEVVTITVRSLEADGVLDPTLTVLDPTGVSIAENDDHRTDRTDLAPRDSLIADLSLSTAGRYTLQVESFDANVEGDAEVLVTSGNAAATETPANQVIDDRVPDNNAYVYTFQAVEGDVLTITVRATNNDLDPKASLLDSSGTEVASNDDHTEPDPSLSFVDSQIVNFVVPKTDTYTIQITGFAGSGGPFELTIDHGGSAPSITPTTPPITPTESSGQTEQVINDTVAANGVYTYMLSAQAGDVYTITVQAISSGLDPRVSVYLGNTYIADNDDYSTNDPELQSTDSRIYDLILTDSGQYTVEVRGYGDTSGDFRLTIDRVATGAPTGLPTEQVELGSVKASGTYDLDFQAEAGDWVTITVRGLTKGIDPYLALLDSSGTVLLDNDNYVASGGDLAYYDARITNYHIVTSGTYTVEVTDFSGLGGSFGVTISTLR